MGLNASKSLELSTFLCEKQFTKTDRLIESRIGSKKDYL